MTDFFVNDVSAHCEVVATYNNIMAPANDKCKYKVANMLAHGYKLIFESEGVLCLSKKDMPVVFVSFDGTTYKCRNNEIVTCI